MRVNKFRKNTTNFLDMQVLLLLSNMMKRQNLSLLIWEVMELDMMR